MTVAFIVFVAVALMLFVVIVAFELLLFDRLFCRRNFRLRFVSGLDGWFGCWRGGRFLRRGWRLFDWSVLRLLYQGI